MAGTGWPAARMYLSIPANEWQVRVAACWEFKRLARLGLAGSGRVGAATLQRVVVVSG